MWWPGKVGRTATSWGHDVEPVVGLKLELHQVLLRKGYCSPWSMGRSSHHARPTPAYIVKGGKIRKEAADRLPGPATCTRLQGRSVAARQTAPLPEMGHSIDED